jgi:predicted alpha/beta superfamily hydrolase
LCIISQNLNAQEVNVSSGSVQRIENFKSQYNHRNIDVWLPEGYSDKHKYAVLYMHDGKSIYDAEITWNKQAWEVDEIASKLMSEKERGNSL